MATEYFNDAWRIPNNKNQSLVSNYSMEFDGSSNFVNVGSSSYLNSLNKISVSSWINSDDYTGSSEQNILNDWNFNTANGHFRFDLTTTGYLRASIKTNTTTYGARIADSFTFTNGTWYHVCFVFDGTLTGNENRLKLFINGVQQTTTQFSNNIPSVLQNSTSEINIGRFGPTSPRVFNGSIDQVSIFDYALPATGTNSVATLYGGGTAVTNPMGLSPAPVAYYQLGDQSVDNGANYLVPNNSLKDYVFDFIPADRITIPSITISTTATISIWVNIRGFSSATQQAFFGDLNTTKLVVNNQSGFVRVIYSGASGFGVLTTDLVTSDFINKWHHIALVQNGGAATVYINNINKGNISGTLRTPDFTTIGAISSGSVPFNGLISNAALFSTNLPATGTESVASLYNNGTPPDLSSYSNLERWYKLNAEDVFVYPNWIIRDSAGSNDGTSSGMTSANLIQSNLQLGVGFSPYALELDGTSQYFNCGTQLGNALGSSVTNFTLSGWYTAQGGASNEGLFGIGNGTTNIVSLTQSNYSTRVVTIGSTTSRFVYDSRNQWANFIVVVSGDGNSPLTLKYYHDGVELISPDSPNFPNSLDFSGNNAYIGNNTNLLRFFKGEISNFSFFNFALTSTQVTELNNNQRTSNLNNLSFAKPLAWWQLGSNSSFNSSTWTALNEGTVVGGNAVSIANMSNDDIVNGVGYSGNGLGTSSIEIVGDAPYSTANGISENMDVLDRTTDVPS